ncbi:hypothetical protein G5I_09578 [Acromyrmex echinatior]|uniref:Uncharacterized protein n=1 Tax=Acromyrmex echinatior TaxID=103372 RepID=F4WUK6_ACREC|nr:hypothetical protein G5I_09578 [Acromyrmex echinatior]
MNSKSYCILRPYVFVCVMGLNIRAETAGKAGEASLEESQSCLILLSSAQFYSIFNSPRLSTKKLDVPNALAFLKSVNSPPEMPKEKKAIYRYLGKSEFIAFVLMLCIKRLWQPIQRQSSRSVVSALTTTLYSARAIDVLMQRLYGAGATDVLFQRLWQPLYSAKADD